MSVNVIVERANKTFAAVECRWDDLETTLKTYYAAQEAAESLIKYSASVGSLAAAWPHESGTVYVWFNNRWNVGAAPDALQVL